jgi:hypothetical protein
MKHRYVARVFWILVAIGWSWSPALAQATVADYQSAMSLRDRYQDLAVGTTSEPRFIERTNRFYYRRSVKGGDEFILVDAATRQKRPAFDHARLAAALSSALKRKIPPLELPFTTFSFTDDEKSIEFDVQERGRPQQGPPRPGSEWRCSLTEYVCRAQTDAGRGRGGRGGGGLAGPVRPPFEINGGDPRKSPDEKLEAVVHNFNVAGWPDQNRLFWMAFYRREHPQ